MLNKLVNDYVFYEEWYYAVSKKYLTFYNSNMDKKFETLHSGTKEYVLEKLGICIHCI